MRSNNALSKVVRFAMPNLPLDLRIENLVIFRRKELGDKGL